MTVECVGLSTCSICKNMTDCRYVFVFTSRGFPINGGFYGKHFCEKCWANIDSIKKYRMENPYNGRVRCWFESSSHPCITCGTYIDNGLLWCPGDTKCIRKGKQLGLCLGAKYPETYNSSLRSQNGIHQYEKFERDNQKYIRFLCKNCQHTFKILKTEFYPNWPSTYHEDMFSHNKPLVPFNNEPLEQYTNVIYRKTTKNPVSGPLRHECLKRDMYRCRECGATNQDIVLEVDHIVPVSQGGSDELDNFQTLCRTCNRAKHNRCWRAGGE